MSGKARMFVAVVVCFSAITGRTSAQRGTVVPVAQFVPALLACPHHAVPDGEPPVEWSKLAQPNEHHKAFDALVGRWVIRLSSPGSEATYTGTAEYKWILGGRFLTEEIKCTLGDAPFEWFGLYGYDNAKKKYIVVWADNFGTGFDEAEGDCDQAGKQLTFRGQMSDVPGHSTKFKWIITFDRADRVLVEMIETGPDGKDTSAMEIELTRA